MNVYIHNGHEHIIDLHGIPLNRTRGRANVVNLNEESIVSFKYNSENFMSSRKIIILCVDINNGVIKTKQNTI